MLLREGCILVIDDEIGVREVISESLKLCGYAVLQASNGRNAMELIGKEYRPDVVVTDVLMPEQDGLETIMSIRQEFPNVKMVAISGGGSRNNIDYLQLAENFGADATLSKPLDMDELERVVGQLFDGGGPGGT